MIKTLNSHLDHFAHLFFPHVCEGCGSDIIENGSLLCAECLSNLPETNFMGEPNNPVEKIFYGRMQIEAAGSAFYFTKHSLLQRLIVGLKYHGNKDTGFYLGKLLGYRLAQINRFNSVDAIIPLPLNPRKERKRGYNQAAIIAEGIATVWKKQVQKNSIQRLVFTETQTHKNRIARWQTMEGVFETVDKRSLTNKHLLLVDDIVTTGATLEACGEKLLEVPGTKLSIVTVAYTI
ncbi:MAG TPA: phosphoribosyltransferase family protein [Chitinophagaceae bacterium]|jgi:ComF family protein